MVSVTTPSSSHRNSGRLSRRPARRRSAASATAATRSGSCRTGSPPKKRQSCLPPGVKASVRSRQVLHTRNCYHNERREVMKNRFRFILSSLVVFALTASAFAQPLSDAAAERLQLARNTANQALSTYSAHYPDRPLWQETFG